MTRNTKYFFGSVGRCLKRASLAVALLLAATTTQPVAAEDSYYKMRVHRSLLQKVIDKNFPVFLEHIQGKAPKDVFLSEVDA